MRIALVVAALVLTLTGCATGDPVITDSPVAIDTESPAPSPSDTASVPIADEPADFPATANPDFQGVQFALDGGQIECAIYDPAGSTEFDAAPFFGCVVSDPDFPYPAMDGGPLGEANAFVSSGHDTARPTQVTDATFGGEDTPLLAGHTLSWSTVTCEAPTDSEVHCTDQQSGHGFRVSTTTVMTF